MLGEEPAEQGPRHVGHAEDDAEVAHVAPPLPGWYNVAHNCLGAHHQPPGSDALDGSEGNQLDHGLGQA